MKSMAMNGKGYRMRMVLLMGLVAGLTANLAGCRDASQTAGEKGLGAGGSLTALPSSAVVVAGGSNVVAYQPDGARAWSVTLPDGETLAAPPVAALSSVTYVRGEQTLFAIAPDGRVLWQSRHQGANDTVNGITPLSDSTVALTQEDRALVAYSSQGDIRWTYNLPENEKLVAAPVLTPGGTVCLRTAGKLYAVDSGGNLAWSVAVDGQ